MKTGLRAPRAATSRQRAGSRALGPSGRAAPPRRGPRTAGAPPPARTRAGRGSAVQVRRIAEGFAAVEHHAEPAHVGQDPGDALEAVRVGFGAALPARCGRVPQPLPADAGLQRLRRGAAGFVPLGQVRLPQEIVGGRRCGAPGAAGRTRGQDLLRGPLRPARGGRRRGRSRRGCGAEPRDTAGPGPGRVRRRGRAPGGAAPWPAAKGLMPRSPPRATAASYASRQMRYTGRGTCAEATATSTAVRAPAARARAPVGSRGSNQAGASTSAATPRARRPSAVLSSRARWISSSLFRSAPPRRTGMRTSRLRTESAAS